MREADSLAVTALLEERRKLRDRLSWSRTADLVKLVVNGMVYLDQTKLNESEQRLVIAAATGFAVRQLEANTEALAALGVTIEEDPA